MSAFNIQVQSLPEGIALLTIEGPLDFATFEKLEAAIQKVVDGGHTRVGVDCKNLEYMNSRSAGLLVATAYNLREKGGDLKFLRLSGRARTVFDLLGITSIVEIFEDEKDLTEAFASGGEEGASAGEGEAAASGSSPPAASSPEAAPESSG